MPPQTSCLCKIGELIRSCSILQNTRAPITAMTHKGFFLTSYLLLGKNLLVLCIWAKIVIFLYIAMVLNKQYIRLRSKLLLFIPYCLFLYDIM